MACSSLSNLLKSPLKPHGSTVHRAVRYLSSSSKPKVSHLSILPSTKTPWLMLPSDVKDGPNGPTDYYFNILDRSLVKVNRHKPYDLVPIPKETTFLGSSRAWVAFTSDTHNSAYIAFPYIHGFTNEFPGFQNWYTNGFHYSLSSGPFSDDIKLVNLSRLGWPGSFSSRSIVPVLASAIWNHRVVYNLEWIKHSAELKIYYFDVTSKYPFQVAGDFCFADQLVDGQRLLSSIMNQDRNAMKAYLVVADDRSKSKEKPQLLLVIMHLQVDAGETSAPKTHNIDLISIDLERKKLECVKSIGDRMIFVGENSEPFILSTRDFPGLKSNSVYIAEDLGYYDLETKCVTRFLWLGDLDNFRPQVCWVAPQSFSFLSNSSKKKKSKFNFNFKFNY